MSEIPLAVDLDGTLVRTDTLYESLLKALYAHPLKIFVILFWILKGKAAFKNHLAQQASLGPDSLPYNRQLLAWLEQQRHAGRTIILCTASNQTVADSIAQHLGIFDQVIASDGRRNLKGANKARTLCQLYGQNGFDYVGDCRADLPVWRTARHAIVVTHDQSLINEVKACCEVEKIFSYPKPRPSAWADLLRVKLWPKNLLLFVPLLAAHQFMALTNWLHLFLALVSFCLCSSCVYIVNDLLDLDSDRRHPRKRLRPFAAGGFPLWLGLALAPSLLLVSFAVAALVQGPFIYWLLFYFLLTCAYSWRLKRIVLVDCLTLSVLHTLRIVAGGAAAGVTLSFWLLALSIFLFLSLAFSKRYTELQTQLSNNETKAHGRGYFTDDSPIVLILGVASGFAAVLVLALYLNSEDVVRLYKSPQIVWGAVLVLLFWVNWVWIQAHRGNMHDDPLVFAMKDKVSLLSGALFALVMILGIWDWTWR
ncbi:UbiA family prenyltransferase [Desulfoferula mesophila]|uniref:Membrane protein n=1 Tax=Desulfoferula mesophila TaxID=3058419 RepID=A0AAU9F0V7_9BACT|nr:membrane protein [Desulfoferula mesophilus]